MSAEAAHHGGPHINTRGVDTLVSRERPIVPGAAPIVNDTPFGSGGLPASKTDEAPPAPAPHRKSISALLQKPLRSPLSTSAILFSQTTWTWSARGAGLAQTEVTQASFKAMKSSRETEAETEAER